MSLKTHDLLREMIRQDASDLHLAAGNAPRLRLHGLLVPMASVPVLGPEAVADLIEQVVTAEEFSALRATGELDTAISLEGGYRVRINAYRQQDSLAAALRLLPNRFFSFEQLGLPLKVLESICALHSGLVLVTGATSSGKSTTIASLIHKINQTRACHIHTIEDPVEYRHPSGKALVTQREIGRDTESFPEALRRSMRQDPDVVVVGEMRDTETMAAALTLAETGHLTFATLHTSSAIQTISRVISAYPASQQGQVRIQLASTLQVVMCQKLIPWDNGQGRSLAAEILVVTPAVRAMVRDEKTHQIKTAMQTHYDLGMRTMNQSLQQLVRDNHLSLETALQYSDEPGELRQGCAFVTNLTDPHESGDILA